MLIDLDNLAAWMGQTLDTPRATQSALIAEGWLKSATRLAPWPTDAPPDDLLAWCMELTALTYVNNPRQAIQRTTGAVSTLWAPDAQVRRQAILDAARVRYDTSNTPMGNFPRAERWPDPAIPRFGSVQWL